MPGGGGCAEGWHGCQDDAEDPIGPGCRCAKTDDFAQSALSSEATNDAIGTPVSVIERGASDSAKVA